MNSVVGQIKLVTINFGSLRKLKLNSELITF